GGGRARLELTAFRDRAARMPAMNTTMPGVRVLAAVLLAALVVSLATPSRAEALEPFTIVAIAGLVVVAVIIVVYLVVANIHDSQRSEATPRYMACVESDAEPRACWALPSAPVLDAASVAPATQGP